MSKKASVPESAEGQALDPLQPDSPFLQSLLDAIPHPVFLADPGGDIVSFNKDFEEKLGEAAKQYLAEALRSRKWEEAASWEEQLIYSDGSLREVLVNLAPLRGAKGGATALLGMVLDITERRRAEAEQAREAEMQALVAETSRLVLSGAVLEDISEHIIHEAARLTGSAWGMVVYSGQRGGSLTPLASYQGGGVETAQEGELKTGSVLAGPLRWVTENRRSLLFNGPGGIPSEGVEVPCGPASRVLAAPALAGPALLGAMALAGSPRDYDDLDLAMLESLADMFALAARQVRTQEQLEQSRDFLNNVIETAEAMVVLRDLQGNIWLFNRSAEEITGWRREDIIGNSWFATISPPDRYPEAWRRFEEFRSTLRAPREPFASPIVTREGEERYISWRSSEVLEGGRVIGLLSVGIDITERRRALEELRESEDKYRTLFETAIDGVFIASPDGTILDCNQAALDMSGYERDEFVGRSIADFISPTSLKDTPQLIERVAGSAASPLEVTAVRQGGREVQVEILAKPIRLGGEERIIGFARDITERKERERELEELNRELRAFASTLSHDLKSPLGVALGYAVTLRRLYQDRLDETGLTGLDALVGSLERINSIIEGMLEYTRAGSAGERSEDVVLGLMVEGIVQELRESGRLGEVSVEVEEGLPVVRGNPLRFHQVLSNLISNAVKFSSGRPGARVRVGCREEEGRRVVFVEDNGPGIAPEDLARIFEPLVRTEDARGLPGHGLGLAIARRAVESWGGRIWAESQPGRGSTFLFTVGVRS